MCAASPAARRLVIYGASSHGLVVAEAAHAAGWQVEGFLDDHPATQAMGRWPILRPADARQDTDGQVWLIIAIGDNLARRRLFSDMHAAGWPMANVIHPMAWVSPSAMLGQGIYIGPMAVVNAQARLDHGVIVNSGAVVEHHNHLHAFSHACPRSAMAGRVTLGPLSTLGTGASVRPGVRIGAGCVIGAGAAVVSDLPDQTLAMGVPAKARRLPAQDNP